MLFSSTPLQMMHSIYSIRIIIIIGKLLVLSFFTDKKLVLSHVVKFIFIALHYL